MKGGRMKGGRRMDETPYYLLELIIRGTNSVSGPEANHGLAGAYGRPLVGGATARCYRDSGANGWWFVTLLCTVPTPPTTEHNSHLL